MQQGDCRLRLGRRGAPAKPAGARRCRTQATIPSTISLGAPIRSWCSLVLGAVIIGLMIAAYLLERNFENRRAAFDHRRSAQDIHTAITRWAVGASDLQR